MRRWWKPSPRQIRAAKDRQEEAHRKALKLLLDWPNGMPPLRTLGAGLGTLVALEKAGLARRLERDQFDELRFVLTDDGRQAAQEQRA